MIRTTAELQTVYGSAYQIAKAVADGKLFKGAHGIYCDHAPELAELEMICARYPNAVLTMESAFAFHGLSDFVPDRYEFATPLNAHRMRSEKVTQRFTTNRVVHVGVSEVSTEHGIIHVYDKERMLIELIRSKNRLSPDYYREVINSYRELVKKGEIDLRKLSKYCSAFKKGQLIKTRIQEAVL